jgi:hypothetical protein
MRFAISSGSSTLHSISRESTYTLSAGTTPLRAILLYTAASSAIQRFPPFISRIHLMVYLPSMLYY